MAEGRDRKRSPEEKGAKRHRQPGPLGSQRGAYYPTIFGQESTSRVKGSAVGGQFTFHSTTTNPSVVLNYLLLDFGGRKAAVAEARQALIAADWTHNAAIQDAVLRVEQAYYQYLNARALQEAEAATVKEAQASLDAATPEADIRPAQSEPEADVFELTDEMALPVPAPAAAFSKIEPQDDIEFTEAKASRRQPAYEPPPFESAAPPRQILSHSTVSAVESAFHSLANTVLSNNARTLEDLVKEMLRPMLKSWLDDNLPGLVERIVKAEIERVSRGGR